MTVLDAVILTVLSEFHVGPHLNKEELNELHQLVLVLLQMEDEPTDQVLSNLESLEAHRFSVWYRSLSKLV